MSRYDSGFSVNVNPARTVKEYTYQDAFANVECDHCGEIQPVFQVVAYYGGTTLLSAFVTEDGIPGAVAQACELHRVLGHRIDAANLAWEEEEARRQASEAAAEDQPDLSDTEDLTKH